MKESAEALLETSGWGVWHYGQRLAWKKVVGMGLEYGR